MGLQRPNLLIYAHECGGNGLNKGLRGHRVASPAQQGDLGCSMPLPGRWAEYLTICPLRRSRGRPTRPPQPSAAAGGAGARGWCWWPPRRREGPLRARPSLRRRQRGSCWRAPNLITTGICEGGGVVIVELLLAQPLAAPARHVSLARIARSTRSSCTSERTYCPRYQGHASINHSCI